MISFGLQRERAGDPDPLALAARELVRVAVVVLGVHAAAVHQLAAPALRVLPSVLWIAKGWPMICPTVCRGLSDEYGSWKIICISRRTGRMSRGAELRDVAAVEADRARRRLEQLQHQPRGRRLAAAGLADDAERLAAAHAERDVLDRVHLAPAPREHARRRPGSASSGARPR